MARNRAVVEASKLVISNRRRPRSTAVVNAKIAVGKEIDSGKGEHGGRDSPVRGGKVQTVGQGKAEGGNKDTTDNPH